MKKLPLGIQSFREIIEDGYVYADKTEYLYNLIQGGKYYFLSRPRRFGKSLLIDTMKELFEGNRALFKGLWIGDSDYNFKPHPVIRLDMTQADLSSTERLRESVLESLVDTASGYGLSFATDSPVLYLANLIAGLCADYGEKVVVLIDEYDKPIIDFLDDPERAGQMRETIGNIYGVLKGQDANLAFVFLTGVSKFVKASVFSKLNNLSDITMRMPYAGICGITESEFDALFPPFIEAYVAFAKKAGSPDAAKSAAEVREAIFAWYDGYTWDGKTRVFNPFSLLSFFANNEFAPYWFSTGTPTFLPPVFKQRPQEYLNLQNVIIDEGILDSHEIERAPLSSLLFQTGFLTVKARDFGPPPNYALGFPNTEVAYSLGRQFLTSSEAEIEPLGDAFVTSIRKALDAGDTSALAEGLSGLYASIPYQLHLPAEAFYHVVFLATMQFLGFRVLGEVSVAGGRADGVIERPGNMVWVLEFKYVADEGALDDAIVQALDQIEERGYARRYMGSNKTVVKAAVCVSGRGAVRVEAER
jgi:hypothetical protein